MAPKSAVSAAVEPVHILVNGVALDFSEATEQQSSRCDVENAHERRHRDGKNHQSFASHRQVSSLLNFGAKTNLSPR